MSLEAATYISQLVIANPAAGDNASQGDDHLRLIKETLQNTFPNASRAFRFFGTDAETAGDVTTDVDDMHKVIPVDASAAARTVTLGAVTIDGWFAIVTKYDSSSNAVTIDPSGATTINGASSLTLTNQYESMLCWWDNSESMWRGMRFFPLKPYYSGGQDIPFSDIAPSANAKRVLAATTATDFSEHTIAAVLEFISTSLARGDLLMRGASFFDRLAPGTSGLQLTSAGPGSDLVWSRPPIPAFEMDTNAAWEEFTTQIPLDNTIPQIGEGDEVVSLVITPTRSDSLIRIDFVANFIVDGGAGIAALFIDGGANAVQVAWVQPQDVNRGAQFVIQYIFTPGDTDPHTITIRAGGSTTSDISINGGTGQAQFGGVQHALLTAQEIFQS